MLFDVHAKSTRDELAASPNADAVKARRPPES